MVTRKEKNQDLLQCWEMATDTSLSQISERQNTFFQEFGNVFGRGTLRDVAGIDRTRFEEILGIKSLPPQIIELFQSAFQVKKQRDYDQFIEKALALNPYYDNPEFSVHSKVGLLRTIGWTYYALDLARIVAAAKVISNFAPRYREAYTANGGDVTPIYWNGPSQWSRWIGRESRDASLQIEKVLRGWLDPEYRYDGEFYNIYHAAF